MVALMRHFAAMVISSPWAEELIAFWIVAASVLVPLQLAVTCHASAGTDPPMANIATAAKATAAARFRSRSADRLDFLKSASQQDSNLRTRLRSAFSRVASTFRTRNGHGLGCVWAR